MIISCWNIRGLNQPQKQKEIVRLILEKKIDVMGIVETKVKLANQIKINNNMFPNWHFVTNSTTELTGRIWVGWNPDKIKLTVLLKCSQMIHVKIEIIESSVSFMASFVYGLHTPFDRRSLWRELKSCAAAAGPFP